MMDKLKTHARATENQAQYIDNIANYDDPLLLSLLSLCKLLHTPHSPESLTAGLPLVKNKLTPQLFVRAATRAGLSAGFIKRPLENISNRVLPAILLLKNQQTCILTHREGDLLTLILPECNDGQKTLKLADLASEYTGSAIFVQPIHKFEDRIDDRATNKVKHWFWDVIY
ncbi:MAG: hypothetical protein KAI17_24905, partial [Thiotrichaceae bacterium]|nr:hypothetical protein [Thiotrichaceae bacterium]